MNTTSQKQAMLKAALAYHDEGLNVIPVIFQGKNPALSEWEEYQTRRTTKDEVLGWFGNGHQYNIGVVHGECSDGYITIDIDHDSGIFSDMMVYFSKLFKGRIEQSGSGEGYHIPLRVKTFPDFGIDSKRGRPRGNRTWKTPKGNANVRARFCQTVVSPSVHPCGRSYCFIQRGEIVRVSDISDLVQWLDDLLPKTPEKQPKSNRPSKPAQGNTLIEAVKSVWGDVMEVFNQFDIIREVVTDQSGDYRLLGNGGLLVTPDKQKFYCFSDEIGGGLFEAWGYCRFGSAYDSKKHFRKVLLEMAETAGIDPKQFYKQDEQRTMMAASQNTSYWGKQHAGYWGRAR